ncbi:unnamed protein product [Clavelina lepadiformis]|uniref:Hydantoinase A/oxoprolinase domain-containing protein n=1 Tax=Clavelina lepadiformis TaxID=159417 RepID=A0ABP0FR12_CLALP
MEVEPCFLWYAMTSFDDQPSIWYDMGGVPTDVSRYDEEYEHVFKSTKAGVTIQAPQTLEYILSFCLVSMTLKVSQLESQIKNLKRPSRQHPSYK